MNNQFRGIYENYYDKAWSIFESHGNIFGLIEDFLDFIIRNEEFNKIINKITGFKDLLKAYYHGDYNDIEKDTIIKVIVCILYIFNPIELFPKLANKISIDKILIGVYLYKILDKEVCRYQNYINDINIERMDIVISKDFTGDF